MHAKRQVSANILPHCHFNPAYNIDSIITLYGSYDRTNTQQISEVFVHVTYIKSVNVT